MLLTREVSDGLVVQSRPRIIGLAAMRTLVVLPTFNEVENLEEVVTLLRQSVPLADILVIDDSSPDGTADLARKMSELLGQIEVLERPRKSGLGSAYRRGFAVAIERGYDVVVEMDSDLSHDPRSLPALIDACESGADLAIGSRYVEGGKIPDWPIERKFLSRGGNLYASAVLGIDVKDATAGFRAYRTGLLSKIEPLALRAEGYGFQIEMAYIISRMGGTIVERPITFVDRVKGDSKMSWNIVGEAMFLVTWWGLRDRVIRPLAALLGIRRRA